MKSAPSESSEIIGIPLATVDHVEINVAPADVVNVTVSVTALRQTALPLNRTFAEIRIVYAYGSDPSKIDHIRKMLSPSDAVEFMGNITDGEASPQQCVINESVIFSNLHSYWKGHCEMSAPHVGKFRYSVTSRACLSVNVCGPWKTVKTQLVVKPSSPSPPTISSIPGEPFIWNVTMSEPVYTGAFAHHNATPRYYVSQRNSISENLRYGLSNYSAEYEKESFQIQNLFGGEFRPGYQFQVAVGYVNNASEPHTLTSASSPSEWTAPKNPPKSSTPQPNALIQKDTMVPGILLFETSFGWTGTPVTNWTIEWKAADSCGIIDTESADGWDSAVVSVNVANSMGGIGGFSTALTAGEVELPISQKPTDFMLLASRHGFT